MLLASANVNGIRAARRRGGVEWLAACGADVVTLQEVRADDAQLRAAVAGTGLEGWEVAHSPSSTKGRAGVALLTPHPLKEVRTDVGAEFDGAGRWVEADVLLDGACVTVASAYVHTGEAGTPRQEEKQRFLEAVGARVAAWAREGRLAVLTGDLNVAHTEHDLKNWKGNRGRAGFLPEEQAHLTRWAAEHGLVDVHRRLHGPGPGPYTWWSWRGSAFDNDAGWRIDYQLATAPLAARAVRARVGRAATYAERWSDHAPVLVDYDL
ncbi:exodeoxyribonuclease III [Phycicoccus endophyticus]|uniref:Exodeoxyribonuclease III n=1 Tax=Phycicoccus endophyticus TaxID=1690220 RepID=A0A7G9R2V0_9MICO|nr:exodeoxyribonuclease III [Phycicoccus endophyticus]NHI20397.1 exodeoxyribonuclease III [Phycicoccus endophyticus]QNN49925.1 exodeoxyribonuclease III [Phycicoccus endophyticus]GGL29558.1 exodeoxyribonuclease III [Phycicoccus endophyticus]